jgi:hypothetical protein
VGVLGSKQAKLLQQIDNIEREGAKKRSGRPAHQDIAAVGSARIIEQFARVDFFRRAGKFAR